MTETLTFSADEVVPERAAALENQGIVQGVSVPDHVEALWAQASGLLAQAAEPVGLLKEISKADFAVVYQGEGKNEPKTPVGDILAQANHLALFAVTVGERISRVIADCFESHDFALGYMLDSVASAAADKLAELAEGRYCVALSKTGRAASATGALRYSPGYCGWHISGQKKLFGFLQPEQIGITLRASFLMEPLKSVSGVIIAGRREIHRITDSYAFCDRCKTHACRDRIRRLFDE